MSAKEKSGWVPVVDDPDKPGRLSKGEHVLISKRHRSLDANQDTSIDEFQKDVADTSDLEFPEEEFDSCPARKQETVQDRQTLQPRYFDPDKDKIPLPETLNAIWYEAIEVQNKRLEEKSERINIIGKAFLNFLKPFVQNWGNLEKEQLRDIEKVGQTLFSLRKNKPKDSWLMECIREICIVLRTRDIEIPDIAINTQADDYLALYREIWVNGTPAYILLQNKRFEAMKSEPLLRWFKPTLEVKIKEFEKEHGELDPELERKLTFQAENEVIDGFNLQFKELFDEEEGEQLDDELGLNGKDVLTALIEEIFDGMPEIYTGDLKTNSISELQEIWQTQEGLTEESWRLKHFAYIKLMIIYSLMKVLGTINFKKKIRIKKWLEYFIKLHNPDFKMVLDIKAITRAVGKDILNLLGGKKRELYLADGREPHPFDIQDIIRGRIEISIPEKVLKTGNPDEIKLYILPVLGNLLSSIQTTSYDRDRLRLSFIGEEINALSGSDHKAFQITLFKMIDMDFQKELESNLGYSKMDAEEIDEFKTLLGELIIIEVQITSMMDQDPVKAKEMREKDDKKYAERKLENLRNLLGVNVTFSEYVNDLADIFIKKYDKPYVEEADGGIENITGRERLALRLLSILTTQDSTTQKELIALFKEKGRVIYSKFHSALIAIWDYFNLKQMNFFRTQVSNIKNVIQTEKRFCTDKALSDICDELLQKSYAISDTISRTKDSSLVIKELRDFERKVDSLSGMFPAAAEDLCPRITGFIKMAEMYHANRYRLEVNGEMKTLQEINADATLAISGYFMYSNKIEQD